MEHKNLIEYLPDFLAGIREMKLIMGAEQPEIAQLVVQQQLNLSDQFILTASEIGLERFERAYGIIKQPGATAQERRFQLLAKFSEGSLYNLWYLKERLAFLCGADGYSLRLEPGAYYIEIKVALTSKHMLEAVAEMIDEVIPCNLIRSVDLLYNTHDKLGGLTHGTLSTYTNKDIRSEAIV